ncbi:MAG: glycosyltransferase family 39 protein [Candidatus Liptonbacteria bacterium]|nr:glycosyltransferase family 39 protein [Candidatus Liptonbacteria bacterium]
MSKKEIAAILFLLIIAAFLRLHNLETTPPGLYPDEAMNGNNALEAIRTGAFKVFYPENNGREGLFINIQALFLAATGIHEPWMLRLPSALIGIMTVLGAFFLFRELARESGLANDFAIGFLGSFLLATSVWHIIFSRIGFRAIMAPFFLVWAAYFLLRAVRTGSWRTAAFSGAALGLGAHTYIAYRIMPLLLLCFVPRLRHHAQKWKIAGAVVLAAALFAAPLLGYYALHPEDFLGRTGQLSVMSSSAPARDLAKNVALTLGMFNFGGDGNWRHNIAGRPELFWPVGVLFLVGAGLAVSRRTLYDTFMLTWFGLALLPVVISNEGLPHALRAILLIPPVFGLSARGGVAIWELLKKRLAETHFSKTGSWRFLRLGALAHATHLEIIAVLFLGTLFYEAYFSYFMAWGQNPNVQNAFAADYVEIGREMRALPDASPKTVVVKAGGVLVRGIPMPAQTVMFMTDSFLPEEQKRKNIRYLTETEAQKLNPKEPTKRGAFTFVIE